MSNDKKKKGTVRMREITGLVLPPHLVKNMIKETRNGKGGNCNMGKDAANTSTNFVELVMGQVVERSRQDARDHKKKRVMKEHVNNGISKDPLLKRLFSDFNATGYDGVINQKYIIEQMKEEYRSSKKKKRKRKALKNKNSVSKSKNGAVAKPAAKKSAAAKQPAKKRKVAAKQPAKKKKVAAAVTASAAQKKKKQQKKKQQEKDEDDDDNDDDDEDESQEEEEEEEDSDEEESEEDSDDDDGDDDDESETQGDEE